MSAALAVGLVAEDDLAAAWTTAHLLGLTWNAEWEMVILDRHPEGPCASTLQSWPAKLPSTRYVALPAPSECSLSALARESDAEMVCMVAAGALVLPRTLQNVVDALAVDTGFDGFIEAVPNGDPRDGLVVRAVTGTSPSPESVLVAARRDGRMATATCTDRPARSSRGWRNRAGLPSNPFDCFDAIFCLSLDSTPDRWKNQQRAYQRLGILDRVERFAAVPTPENTHRGTAMSWRSMIAEADRRGHDTLLVFEDDAVFLDHAVLVLDTAVRDLAAVPWDLCYLGAAVWGKKFPLLPGSSTLQACGPVTCTHALAVHRRAFARILSDIPPNGPPFDRWLHEQLAIDQYLARAVAAQIFSAVIVTPRIATQPVLMEYDDSDRELAERYVRPLPNAL